MQDTNGPISLVYVLKPLVPAIAAIKGCGEHSPRGGCDCCFVPSPPEVFLPGIPASPLPKKKKTKMVKIGNEK